MDKSTERMLELAERVGSWEARGEGRCLSFVGGVDDYFVCVGNHFSPLLSVTKYGSGLVSVSDGFGTGERESIRELYECILSNSDF